MMGKGMQFGRVLMACMVGLSCLSSNVWAGTLPTISIIIDDLGYRLEEGRQVIQLPGPLAYAVIPHTPFGRHLAEEVHAAGKEVMVHVPMQSMEDSPSSSGELMLDMTEAEFSSTLQAAFDAVPHAIGINNHQGSLLTRHPGHMAWLMQALEQRGGLFFVDSRTSRQSVAEQLAHEYQIPALRRDVFLDHQATDAFIRGQFDRLVDMAKRRGYAVAIGHPYPETIRVLKELLPQLPELGVQLIPISRQIQRHQPKPKLRLTAIKSEVSTIE